MKKLTSITLALCLAFGASMALAKDGHKNGNHAKSNHKSQGWQAKHPGGHQAGQSNRHKNSHQRSHNGKQHGSQHSSRHGSSRYGGVHNGGHHNRGHHSRGYYRPYYYGGYPRGHWRYSRHNYYPSYLGAALVGSLITHSYYHMHNGAVCYDRHNYDSRNSNGYTEVVGCHRLEQLPDGTQQRVEVPLSQCQ